MAIYTPFYDFTAKDALASGDSNKLILGSQVDFELDAIETAIATKSNIADPTFTGEIGIGAVNVSETELGILEGLTATTTELNVMDAGATVTTPTVAGGDAFVMDDLSVGMRQVDIDNVDTYLAATTKTLTNKSIDGDDNTITDLHEASITTPTTGSSYRHVQDPGDFTSVSGSTEETDLLIVVPRAGAYQVSYLLTGDGSGGLARLYKDDSTAYSGRAALSAEVQSTSATRSATFTFDAGDLISLNLHRDGGGTTANVSLFRLESAIKLFG